MKVYYGKAVYNNREIAASMSVLKNKSLTLIDGPSVKELEKRFSKHQHNHLEQMSWEKSLLNL